MMMFFFFFLLSAGTVFSEELLKNETIRSIKPKHFQIDLPGDLVLDPYENSRPRVKRQYVQYSPYQPQAQPQYYPPQPVQQVYYPQAPQAYLPQQYQQVQYSRPQGVVAPQQAQYPRYDLRPQPVLVPRVQQRVLNPAPAQKYMTTPTPRLIITNAPRHIGYVTLVTAPPKYIAPVVATRRIPQPVTAAPYIAPIATTLAPTVPYVAPTTVKYVAPTTTTRYVAPTTTTVKYVAPTVATTRYVAPTTTTRYVAPTTTTRYVAPTTTTTTTTTTTQAPTTTTTVRYIETTTPATTPATTVSIPPTTLTLTTSSPPTTTSQWVQEPVPEEPLPLEAYFPSEAVETPKFDETFVGQYYYGKRGQGNTTFPLPSCFYNPSGYVCCSLMLNELMTASFEETRKGKGSVCNVQRIANALQKHSEKIFNTQFETIVSYEDFSQKIHFKRDLVCKIEVEGRFILAYATPEFVEAQKIIPTVPSKNIVKDSAILKEELRQRIQQSDRVVVAN